MMWKPVPALVVAVLSLPAIAQEGMWMCDFGGERLNFEGNVVQFNEHTICTAENPIQLIADNGHSWSGPVNCENIYVAGQADDGTFVTNAVPVDGFDWLALTLEPNGMLVARSEPDGPSIGFFPC